ncbi:glutathione S-transferase [Sphingomonas montanisoli]|uniref:Glutathione S-transferase n=1 Tax=Sphingomonas montanisoli TaxID=2606412 RepID=A0A5D9C490_9SPHN|nr:glutathione S-transferase [Sphingomonas montanisoli]TZG26283.1 glutathione S-transferase [Sphingomonas montanisoli]
MANAVLTISSKNYSSWSLRGWLLCKLAGLDVTEERVPIDAPGQRAELLLLSPSVLVPRLTHDDVSVWDTLAIAEYLNECFPEAGLYPADAKVRAHCRSISGEIHSGFHNLRSALPMNLKARNDSFRLFAGAKPDIDRIQAIWRECLSAYGGPWLFGDKPTVADAMFAPVATRFQTYAIPLDAQSRAYSATVLGWDFVKAWTAAAIAEPEEMEELDAEF